MCRRIGCAASARERDRLRTDTRGRVGESTLHRGTRRYAGECREIGSLVKPRLRRGGRGMYRVLLRRLAGQYETGQTSGLRHVSIAPFAQCARALRRGLRSARFSRHRQKTVAVVFKDRVGRSSTAVALGLFIGAHRISRLSSGLRSRIKKTGNHGIAVTLPRLPLNYEFVRDRSELASADFAAHQPPILVGSASALLGTLSRRRPAARRRVGVIPGWSARL